MSYAEFDQWDPMTEHYESELNSFKASRSTFNRSGSSHGEPFLYITNVPYDLEQEKLIQIFSTYGDVISICIKPSKIGRADKCYGFVHYSSVAEARRAYSRIDRNNILDMRVQLGKSREQRNQICEDYGHDQNKMNFHRDPSVYSTNDMNHDYERHQSARPNTTAAGSRMNTNNSVEDWNGKYDERTNSFLPNPPVRSGLINKNQYPDNREREIYPREDQRLTTNGIDNIHEKILHSFPPSSQPQISGLNENPTLSLSTSHSVQSNYEGSVRPVSSFESNCSNMKGHCQHACNHCHHAAAHNHTQHCCSCQSSCQNLYSSCAISHNSFSPGCGRTNKCCLPETNVHDPSVPPLKPCYALCSYCRREGKFVCTTCEEPYCSRLCQEKDWPHHKTVCLGLHKSPLPVPKNDVSLNNTTTTEMQENELKPKDMIENQIKPLPNEFKTSKQNNSPRSYNPAKNSQHAGLENRRNSPGNSNSRAHQNKKPPLDKSKETACNSTSDYKRHEKNQEIKNNSRISPQKPRSFSSPNQKLNIPSNIQQKPHSFNEDIGSRRDVESESHKSYAQNGYLKPNMRKKRLDYDPTESRRTNNKKSLEDNDRKGVTKNENSITKNGGALTEKTTSTKQDSRNTNILVPDKIKASAMKLIRLHISDILKVNVCYVLSLHEFCVQRVADIEMLNQIGSEMLSLSERKTVLLSPEVDDVCGALYSDNLYYRAQIKKVLADNMYLVYFLDYGNVCSIKSTDLCYLTSSLGNYPALALKFQLMDIKPKSGDRAFEMALFGFFSHIVEDKILSAHIYGISEPTYLVDLVTEEGVSVSAILKKEGLAEDISSETVVSQGNGIATDENSKFQVPTLMEKLKESAKYAVTPIYTKTDVIWGFVDDEDTLIEFNKLTTALQESNAPDNSMMIKESELTAAFSPADQTWYRAVVIKRKKNSFCVCYIDYGNEEEVSKLRSLSREHIEVRSPLLAFKILSKEHLNNITELSSNTFEVTIKLIQKGYFEAETIYVKQSVKLVGYDWPSEEMLPSKFSMVPSQDKAIATVEQPEIKPLPLHGSDNTEKIRISEKVLIEREMPSNTKTQVTVSWVKSIHEIYVQKKSDEAELNDLLQDINTFCNCSLGKTYKPIEGEIVCARYVVDDCWYRSLVLKLLPEEKVHVLFIDYGNEEDISLQNIKELNEKFLQPIYSICISLYNMPLSVVYNDVCEKLLNKCFELKVIHSDVIPKQVVLFQDGKQVFGSDGEAKVTSICSNLRPSKLNKQAVSYPTQKKDVLETRISDFDGAIVRIEYIDTAKIFHVRLISQDDQFASMQRELFEFCQKHSTTAYLPGINDVVCARWKNSWNRGYITDVKEDSCMVKFIDQGPILEIVVIDIKPLAPEFFHPVFMISVSLESVPESKLTNEVCQSLKNCFYSLKLLGKSEPPFTCKMYLDQKCINDSLIEKSQVKTMSAPIIKSEPSKFPQFSALKKQSLPSNEILDAVFWFQENDLYFLHKASDFENSLQLEMLLQQKCQSVIPLNELPEIGDVVCAKCSDGLWYRACIEEVNSVENKCRVLFIDYGNSEYVAKNDLSVCPPDIICIPVFCICVKIMNVKDHPVVMNELVTIKTSETVTNPAIISIYVAEENGSQIDKLPITQEIKPVSPVVEPEPAIANRFMIDNLPLIDFPDGNVPIVIYSMLGDALFAAPYSKDNIEKNVNLVEEITAFCVKSNDNGYKPVEPHEVVLAKFRDDDSWYRAAVLDIGTIEHNLFFIDFGGSQLTKEEDIRKMTNEFFELPIQAHTCTLGGFKYDEVNKEKIAAVATKELPCFVEIEAIASEKEDTIIIEIPLFNKKLQEMGLIQV